VFTSISEFVTMWKQEMKWTHNVLAGLTDKSLSQPVEPEGRTLGRIGWHLAQSVPEIMNRTGLKVNGPDEHESPPENASKIVSEYDAAAESVLDEVQKNWKD